MKRFRKIGIELRIEAEYLNLEKQGIKNIEIFILFILAAMLHTCARTQTHTHIYTYTSTLESRFTMGLRSRIFCCKSNRRKTSAI
jgi:hypothetical protein